MDIQKALEMVDSILDTHADQNRVKSPEATGAIEAARTDLHGLMIEVIEDCTAQAMKAAYDATHTTDRR